MSSNSKSSPRFVKLELALPGAQSMPPEQEQLLKSFMLQSVHLDASINEFASHGTLTFIFKNPLATPVEMCFAFPLMDGGAVVTGIATEWDGQRISGRVRASAEGKKEYSDAIAKGHTASLVEHAENDLFLWRVGGIPGASTVTVTTQFCGPVTMAKKCGKKPQTEITLTLPAVVPPWYGKADVGVAALAFDTAVQAPASVGGLALAAPPFTATVCSRFVTKSLQGVSVTSPTHGPPDASSFRTSNDGCEVSFRDLFKPPAGSKAATNLQMRWVADGIVPNMACLGRVLAGAGQLNALTAGSDSIVSRDAAATLAMEAAAEALAAGPLAQDARALLDKIKTQQRKMEQVCGVLYSEQDGKQPEGVHVTVLVDCSGSMYPKRIEKARKAVRALLTSLDPTSTFSVYLFGSSCRAILLDEIVDGIILVDAPRGPVFEASPENINAIAAVVDAVGNMGGTALFAGVQQVMRNQVPAGRRHNVMILTDGEVGGDESTRVKLLLAAACPASALVGIIGIGNEVTRSTLRTVVEGGLGPQAIMFDSESDESIARIVLGSVNALITSQLRQVNWPGDKMVGSQPHIQWNSSEVCAAWALYPEAALVPAPHAAEDEDWEMVAAGDAAAVGSAPLVRWLGGASVSVTAPHSSADSSSQLPTFLITDERAVRSMCIAAALARCRHPSCGREEATKLALRYGFVCAEADSVMIAMSDHPTGDASCATFGIAIPSGDSFSSRREPLSAKRCRSKCGPDQFVLHQQFVPQQQQPQQHQCNFGSFMAASYGPSHSPSNDTFLFPCDEFSAVDARKGRKRGANFQGAPVLQNLQAKGPSRPLAKAMALSIADSAPNHQPASTAMTTAASLGSPPPTSASNPSLLDILGALQRASWSLQHSAVAAFLAKHLPAAAALMTSDAHATVAVIVVLRAKFKGSKAGWHAHVKRAAQSARLRLGDSEYATLKISLVNAMSA